jgi:hypothetical protein
MSLPHTPLPGTPLGLEKVRSSPRFREPTADGAVVLADDDHSDANPRTTIHIRLSLTTPTDRLELYGLLLWIRRFEWDRDGS